MDSFDKFVIDNEIIGFFDEAITLKSGRKSNFYVNWRKATNDAYLLDQLTDHIVSFLAKQDVGFDSLIGVPEGASKTAVLTALKWAKAQPQFGKGSHVIPMGRAKPKSHGLAEDRYFIGSPKGRVLVLEDTITTGLSLFTFIDELLASGVDVVGAVCLTDRMEKRDDQLSVEAFIKKRYEDKVEYLRMSGAHNLLPILFSQQAVPTETKKAILEEFARYGAAPLNIEESPS